MGARLRNEHSVQICGFLQSQKFSFRYLLTLRKVLLFHTSTMLVATTHRLVHQIIVGLNCQLQHHPIGIWTLNLKSPLRVQLAVLATAVAVQFLPLQQY